MYIYDRVFFDLDDFYEVVGIDDFVFVVVGEVVFVCDDCVCFVFCDCCFFGDVD